MRRAPPWTDGSLYPVVVGTIGAATIVSAAHWMGRDVSFLFSDAHLRRGELWRLVTSALPHVNVLHLAFNLYWTWVFGTLVESSFGHVRTIGIFALFAAVASAAEIAIFQGGIGLSGVGYGLFGLVWVLQRRDPRFADAIDQRTTWLFVGWFFLCILTTVTGSMNVANVAHAAGGVVGALLGWTIGARGRARVRAAAGTVLFGALALLGATVRRPWVNIAPDRGLDESRLGYESLLAGEPDEAVRWLSMATELNPKDARSWFNLGVAYQRLNRLRDASLAYETARRLEPDNPAYRGAREGDR